MCVPRFNLFRYKAAITEQKIQQSLSIFADELKKSVFIWIKLHQAIDHLANARLVN
jgi:hypothetical protein